MKNARVTFSSVVVTWNSHEMNCCKLRAAACGAEFDLNSPFDLELKSDLENGSISLGSVEFDV